MPAFFEMTLEFSRYEVDVDNFKELNAYLSHGGMKFISGYAGAENCSLEEITDWNQKKLEDDFTLAIDEDVSNDYRQSLFEYGGFSGIRGFVHNGFPVSGEFTYNLLIPEDEIVTDSGEYRSDAVDKLKALASALWLLPKVRTIQTGLELSGTPVPEAEIMEGKAPLAHPFAVVSEKQLLRLDETQYEAEHITAGGVIIIPKKHKLVTVNERN